MTVEELIQELEYFDRNLEISFASQPSWPFEYSVSGVIESGGKVWLVEGSQLGYLPKSVNDDIGW